MSSRGDVLSRGSQRSASDDEDNQQQAWHGSTESAAASASSPIIASVSAAPSPTFGPSDSNPVSQSASEVSTVQNSPAIQPADNIGFEPVAPRVRPCVLTEDQRWIVRKTYLPAGTTGMDDNEYSDAQCISFLCEHLLTHFNLPTSQYIRPNSFAPNSLWNYTQRTPASLHTLMVELGDSLCQVARGLTGMLPNNTANQLVHLLITMLEHPEPFVRTCCLELLQDPCALHFLLSCSPTLHLRLLNTLQQILGQDEYSMIQDQVLFAWEAIYSILLTGSHQVNNQPPQHMQFSIKVLFDDLIQTISCLFLPQIPTAQPPANSQVELSSKMLTIPTDGDNDEYRKLHTLYLLAGMLEHGAILSHHVRSNRDLVFFLVVECLKLPQVVGVQRELMKLLSYLGNEGGILKKMTADAPVRGAGGLAAAISAGLGEFLNVIAVYMDSADEQTKKLAHDMLHSLETHATAAAKEAKRSELASRGGTAGSSDSHLSSAGAAFSKLLDGFSTSPEASPASSRPETRGPLKTSRFDPNAAALSGSELNANLSTQQLLDSELLDQHDAEEGGADGHLLLGLKKLQKLNPSMQLNAGVLAALKRVQAASEGKSATDGSASALEGAAAAAAAMGIPLQALTGTDGSQASVKTTSASELDDPGSQAALFAQATSHAAVRQLFAESTKALKSAMKERCMLAKKLRQIMRVPGTYLKLDRVPDELQPAMAEGSDSALFTALPPNPVSSTPVGVLYNSSAVKAMLPNCVVDDSHSVILTLLAPAFPGVPSNATTIPAILLPPPDADQLAIDKLEKEAKAAGAVVDPPMPEAIDEEDEKEEEEEGDEKGADPVPVFSHEEKAARKAMLGEHLGVPPGFSLTNSELVSAVPHDMTPDLKSRGLRSPVNSNFDAATDGWSNSRAGVIPEGFFRAPYHKDHALQTSQSHQDTRRREVPLLPDERGHKTLSKTMLPLLTANEALRREVDANEKRQTDEARAKLKRKQQRLAERNGFLSSTPTQTEFASSDEDEYVEAGIQAFEGPRDFSINSCVSLEICREKDDMNQPIAEDLQETLTYECVVTDVQRSVLAVPMSIQDQLLAQLETKHDGKANIGLSFMIQVSDKSKPNVFWDVQLEIFNVFNDMEFLKKMLQPPDDNLLLEEQEKEESDKKSDNTTNSSLIPEFEDEESKRMREIEEELKALDELDPAEMSAAADAEAKRVEAENKRRRIAALRLKRSQPVAAGISDQGVPFFYPPVNIAPLPISYDEDGRPIYRLPGKVQKMPVGYTVDGQPFFEQAKRRDGWHEGGIIGSPTSMNSPSLFKSGLANETFKPTFGQLMGYTRAGIPFALPTGAIAPKPSGYTAQGVPYYEAPHLLKFLEDGERNQAKPKDAVTIGSDGKPVPSTQTSDSSASETTASLVPKEKPFFRTVLSKRRLRFMSEGVSCDIARQPFDVNQSLSKQLSTRLDAESARREQIERNEEDGIIDEDLNEQENALRKKAIVDKDHGLPRDSRLPKILTETIKFNLASLDKDSVLKDEMPELSPTNSPVSSKERLTRRKSRATLKNVLTFTDAQKQNLQFRISAIPARYFSVSPAFVDMSHAATFVQSPELTVTFDATQCPPSRSIEGRVVVRWDDGSNDGAGLLLAHIPIHARVGPFVSLSRAEGEGAEADQWCAMGTSKPMKFLLANLTDFALAIQMDLVEYGKEISEYQAARAVALKNNSELPPAWKPQYSLESLHDESFELPPGGSRVVTVIFTPLKEGFFEALVTCTAGGVELLQYPVAGIGGLPVAFQILQGNLKTKGDKPDHSGKGGAAAESQRRKKKKEEIERLKLSVGVRKITKQEKKEQAAKAAAESGIIQESVTSDSAVSSSSSEWSSDYDSDEDSDYILGEDDEPLRPLLPPATGASAIRSQVMVLDLDRPGSKDKQNSAHAVVDLAQALRDAEGGAVVVAKDPEQIAKEERRARRRIRKPKYRPLSASHMSYFQESLDKGGREHFVDFGIVDIDSPTQLRAIDMQNLLTYKVIIVVSCKSVHFDVKTKFHEVPARGSSKIPVTFKPKPGMDGLVTGTLEVFWQDSTHTVFHLQAFVGQPLVFNLAPKAFFAPCVIGDERHITTVAYNRSPYHLHWDCTPFGPMDSLAFKSFRLIHRSRSQEGFRSEEEEAAVLAANQSKLGASPIVKAHATPGAGTSTIAKRKGLSLFDGTTQLHTKPYANSLVTLVFTCVARGLVTAPLGVKLMQPHRQDYWACRTHAVMLVGIGLQASYSLPLSFVQESEEQKQKERAEIEAENKLKAENDGSSMALASSASSTSISKESVQDINTMEESMQNHLLNAFNLDFGGSDLRSDLARLQQWLLSVSSSVASITSSIPPATEGTATQYKSRLKRKRFLLNPNSLSLLGRWKAGDREDDTNRREINAMWQLIALANTEPEEFVVLRTPGLTVQPWQGTLLSDASIAALGPSAYSLTLPGRQIQADGTMLIPGSVSFRPAPGPTEYCIFEGFILAVSLLDKHFISVPVHSERSHGVLIAPEKALPFPRVLVDSKETEYILLRSRMLAPVTWTLSFPSTSGYNSFVVPVRNGRLEPSETEVVKISFEPNAQGHYKEVAEIRIHDVHSGELVLSRELLLTGTGHSPHIVGFPSALDFGNVPLGWMGFVWISLSNLGFVDDEVSIFAPPPFMTSDSFLRIKAKSTARVGLMFCPHKAATVKKSFTILAGGKVVRIATRGRGGIVKVSCKSKEPEGSLIKSQAPTAGFPDTAVGVPSDLSNENTRCHIHFGTAQMETTVAADLHVINEGSLPVRVDSISIAAEFQLVNEGCFSNDTAKKVEISTKANRWAMISKQKTGVAMAVNAFNEEQTKSPSDGLIRHSSLIRPATSTASELAQVVKEAAATVRRMTKRPSIIASRDFGALFTAATSPITPIAQPMNISPVLFIPPGHTLRLKVEFRPRREQEFDTVLNIPFSEDITKPVVSFEQDAEDAAQEDAEKRARKIQMQAKTGVAMSTGEEEGHDPFSIVASGGSVKQSEIEVGYLNLANVTAELALYFAFMRRREHDSTEAQIAAEQMGMSADQFALATKEAIQRAEEKGGQPSAAEQTILDAYRSLSLDQLRDMAYETDLYSALMPRALTDPSVACLQGSLNVRLSGGCFGSITLTPSVVNFGPVAAGRFLLATNRNASTGTQMLAHRQSVTSKVRRLGVGANEGATSLVAKAARKIGAAAASVLALGGSTSSANSSKGLRGPTGWATRRAPGARPSISGAIDTGFNNLGQLEEEIPNVPAAINMDGLIPGLLPGELQSSLAVEDESEHHPAFDVLTNGMFSLGIHNGSIHQQSLKLEYIKPPCFALAEESKHLKKWELASGENQQIQLTFHPHETNTVYMGVAVFTHLFGTLTIPLRGVGAAAHIQLVGLQPADSTSLLSGVEGKTREGATIEEITGNSSSHPSGSNTVAPSPSPPSSAVGGVRDSPHASPSASPLPTELDHKTPDLIRPTSLNRAGSFSRPTTGAARHISTPSIPEAPLGSSAKPLGGRWVLRFPPVKLHTLAAQSFTMKNQGLLPARYIITCNTTPFSLEDPVTKKDTNVLKGVLDSNESVKIRATCLLFVKQKDAYAGELSIKWQMVPRGIWVEERVDLSAKIGRPQLSADSTLLNFGTVVLNRPAVRKFTLKNAGDAPLEWEAVDLEASVAEHVEIIPRSGSIKPNARAVLRVLFQPSSLDFLNANLHINSDGGEVRLQLQGSVLVPQLNVPELTKSFGIVQVGQRASHRFELFNSGATAIQYLVYLDGEAHVNVSATSSAGSMSGDDNANYNTIGGAAEGMTLLDQVREATEIMHERLLISQGSGASSESPYFPQPRQIAGGDRDALPPEVIEDALANIQGLKHVDSLDPVTFDAHRKKQEQAIIAKGGKLPDPKKPFMYQTYAASPWSASLLPRSGVSIEISVNPKEIGVSYVARIVVAPGTIITEKASIPTVTKGGKDTVQLVMKEAFQSLDVHAGILTCIGGGADLTLHINIDRDKFQSWESDLGIDPNNLMLPGIVPMGLLMTSTTSSLTLSSVVAPVLKSTRTISIRNTGNLPGNFSIEPIGGGNERLERALTKEQTKAGIDATSDQDPKKPDDTVFTIFPLSATIAPGENVWLTISVSSTRKGFLQQQYRISSADSSLRQDVTLLAYGGESKLDFVLSSVTSLGGASAQPSDPPGLDFGVSQIGVPVVRAAVLRNSGNQNVSFTATLTHISRSDQWREGKRPDRLNSRGNRRGVKPKTYSPQIKSIGSGAVISEDLDEKHDASSLPSPSNADPSLSPPLSPRGDESITSPRAQSLPLPPISPFALLQPAGTVFKIAAHTETRIEIRYTPADDGIRDIAELKLDWLGPSLIQPVYGAAGTGALEVSYPELDAQQTARSVIPAGLAAALSTPASKSASALLPAYDFGLSLVNQTHWRPLVIRNTGTLDMEFRVRVSNPDLVSFKSSQAISVTNTHRILAKKSLELQVGMTPSALAPVGATLSILSTVPDINVPLEVTGARFSTECDKEIRYGEVSIDARITKTFRLSNTGDLAASFLLQIGEELKHNVAIPGIRIRRAPPKAPPPSLSSSSSLAVPNSSSDIPPLTLSTPKVPLDRDGYEVVEAVETDMHGNIIPKRASAAQVDAGYTRRTQAAFTAIKRASVMLEGAASSSNNPSTAALMATIKPHFQYYLPLNIKLAPNDEAEVTVDFFALQEVSVSGNITIIPSLDGATPIEVFVKARSAQMKIALNDVSDLNVGKVMLNHMTTVARTLSNFTKRSNLRFRIEIRSMAPSANVAAAPTITATVVDSAAASSSPLAEDESVDPSAGTAFNFASTSVAASGNPSIATTPTHASLAANQVWTVTPMQGILPPQSSLDLSVVFNSIDQDESNWHPVQIRILNVTQGTVDASFMCQGSVAFPRLSMFPLDSFTSGTTEGTDDESMISRPTSPLWEEEERDSAYESLGLSSPRMGLKSRLELAAAAASAEGRQSSAAAAGVLTKRGDTKEPLFNFGVRSVGDSHFRPFGARNDGTGSLQFRVRITLTKRTHEKHMVEVAKIKAKEAREAKVAASARKVQFAEPSAPLTDPTGPHRPSVISSTSTGSSKKKKKTKEGGDATPTSSSLTLTVPGSEPVNTNLDALETPLTNTTPFFLVSHPESTMHILGGSLREHSPAEFLLGFRPLVEEDYHAVMVMESEAGSQTLHLRGRGSKFEYSKSLSLSQELTPPTAVLDFGVLLLGQEATRTFIFENLCSDFNAIWISQAPDENGAPLISAAQLIELMSAWSEVMAVQGKLLVEDVYSLTKVLERSIIEERKRKQDSKRGISRMASRRTPSIISALITPPVVSKQPSPDPVELKISDISNESEADASNQPPKEMVIRKRKKKPSQRKPPTLIRLMSVDVLEDAPEDDADVIRDPTPEGVEGIDWRWGDVLEEEEEEKDEATLAAEALTQRADAARTLLAKKAKQLASAEMLWKRATGCFSYFPESVFLGPRALKEEEKAKAALEAQERQERKADLEAEAKVEAAEAAIKAADEGKDNADTTFLTSVDGKTEANAESSPPSESAAAIAAPTITVNVEAPSVSVPIPKKLPTLASLAPASMQSFSFNLSPPLEYDMAPPSIAKSFGAEFRMSPTASAESGDASNNNRLQRATSLGGEEKKDPSVPPEEVLGTATELDQSIIDRRVPNAKRMLELATIDPVGKLYTRALIVRTLTGSFPLQLRARFSIFPLQFSRNTINFGKTLTNSPLFRRITITNPAPYNVPFRVHSNHPCFTAELPVGLIPPETSMELVIRFVSPDPLDTHDTNQTPVAPTLRIHTLDGVFDPYAITCHCTCTDYIFSTKLFHDIEFGTVFVKANCESFIQLVNVTDDDVDYRLVYEKRGDHVPITINLADQQGIVRVEHSKRVAVRFDPTEECDVDLNVGIETRAGTFNIRVTGRAVWPTVSVSTTKLNFGVVGIGYTVEKIVTVTNTCLLPLRVYARPAEVEEEVGTGQLLSPGEDSSTSSSLVTATATPTSLASLNRPQSYLVDLAKNGVIVRPQESFDIKVHYSPVSSPVLIKPQTYTVMKKQPSLLSPGSLDTSSVKEAKTEEEYSEEQEKKLLEEFEADTQQQEAASAAGIQVPPSDAEPSETTASPSLRIDTSTAADGEVAEIQQLKDELSTKAASSLPAPSLSRKSSVVSTGPASSSTSAAAPLPTPVHAGRTTRQASFAVPSWNQPLRTTGGGLLGSGQGQWEFPIDRLTIPLYAEGRDTMVASIKCVGKGGLMNVVFSHHTIEFGTIPKGTKRQDEISIMNRGDVPVQLSVSCANNEMQSSSILHKAGRLTVELLDERNTNVISLAPGEDKILHVELNVTGEGGDFDIPFRVNLLGTTAKKNWLFHVAGFVDDIKLSAHMEAFLREEKLVSIESDQVPPNPHVPRVLQPVDYVANVSVAHQIARVEPLLFPPSLDSALAIPPALAPSVLMTFKRWYYNRAPLRMTVQHDEFAQLQAMLADQVVERYDI